MPRVCLPRVRASLARYPLITPPPPLPRLDYAVIEVPQHVVVRGHLERGGQVLEGQQDLRRAHPHRRLQREIASSVLASFVCIVCTMPPHACGLNYSLTPALSCLVC